MVRKAYSLSLLRMFKSHIIRFFSISAIFVVAVGFLSGIGDSCDSVDIIENKIYRENNVHDFIVLGTDNDPIKLFTNMSLTYNELYGNKDKYGINDIEKVISQDIVSIDNNEGFASRYSHLDINNKKIDEFTLEKGRFPNKEYEVVVEHPTIQIKEIPIGYKFIDPIFNKECEVVGVVFNNSIFANENEKSLIDESGEETTKNLDAIYYINNTSTVNLMFNQLYITFADRNNGVFTSGYKTKVDNFKSVIKGLEINKVKVGDSLETLSLYENYSFRLFDGFKKNMGGVTQMFMIVFLSILLLMIYSTMSRLLDEERGAIATLKTLGYSNKAISFRYIIFLCLGALVGLGLAIGPAVLVNFVIVKAFKYQLIIKSVALSFLGKYFWILAVSSFATSIILVAISNHYVLKKKPVELLVAKTPKFGRRILLEKIKFIWNKLSFKYKSVCRNIFLFRSRLIMTLLSIILSSAMVFVSFSMLSNSFKREGSSLIIISITVLVFSAILSALIVYNITNINISERKREIATLMVLGYHDNETCGYIFREISITVVIASIIGLPIAVLICYLILDYTNMGVLSVVEWWWYLLTPVCTIAFAIIAMLLFRPKIVKINMNESLKTLE